MPLGHCVAFILICCFPFWKNSFPVIIATCLPNISTASTLISIASAKSISMKNSPLVGLGENPQSQLIFKAFDCAAPHRHMLCDGQQAAKFGRVKRTK